MMPGKIVIILSVILGCAACTDRPTAVLEEHQSMWLLIDDFESGLGQWTHVDVENNTDPFVPDPQQLVFEDAVFRVRRTAPLQYFMTTCNTGPPDRPYGNGGVRYDDIYMTPGRNLTLALQ